MTTSVEKKFEEKGFKFEQTGGDCTAWVKPCGDKLEMLITDGDLSAPLNSNEKCVVSLMSTEHGEPLKEEVFETAEDFFRLREG